MKFLYTLLFVFLIVSCSAPQKITAVKNNRGYLIGVADKNSFNQAPYQQWFSKNYDAYSVDQSLVNALKKDLKGVTIKGFMGTWCGDSRRETPRFYKVLEAANFNFKNLELVTVNRSKKTPDNLQEGYNIIRVPTFIFFKDEKEIGRYVEYARESLEKDIATIVSGKPYKHSYEN